jgi:hypothetical protein
MMVGSFRGSAFGESQELTLVHNLRRPKVASRAYFLGECPTCSRKLEIRVELLGKRVACQHCGATHVASDAQNRQNTNPNSDQKIDQLLARAKAYVDSVESPHATTSE